MYGALRVQLKWSYFRKTCYWCILVAGCGGTLAWQEGEPAEKPSPKKRRKLKRKLSEASHAEEPAQPEQELQEDVAE